MLDHWQQSYSIGWETAVVAQAMSLLPRFCKPLDMPLLRRMAKEHPIMITVEENGIGGFGSHGEPRCGFCILLEHPSCQCCQPSSGSTA